MKTVIIAIIAIAALATAGAAAATVNHVYGNGGDAVAFDAACHRPNWAKPDNLTTRQGLNVVTQQARCLVRRPTFAACVHRLGPPPAVVGKFDHGDGKPGDWSGVDKLQAYLGAVYACSKGTF